MRNSTHKLNNAEVTHHVTTTLPENMAKASNCPRDFSVHSSEQVEFRSLTIEDASAVIEFEAATYLEDLQQGEQIIREGLRSSIEDGSELSFGMFESGKLVGYLLCFGCEPSHFGQFEGEWVVYIEDINIQPKYRHLLFRLIHTCFAEIQNKFPEAAIEAHSLENILNRWKKHKKSFADLGLELRLYEKEDEKVSGQNRYRMRWHQPHTKTAYSEHIASLPGNTYCIDGDEYSVKLLQDENDWSIYEPVWDSLVKQSSHHNLFQSYDFIRYWWHYFAQDKKLYILFVCKENEIIGFASFNILKRKIRTMTFDEIGFIGSPFEVDQPGIVMSQDEQAGIKSIISYLSDNRQDWDLLQIFEQQLNDSLSVMKQTFKEKGLLVGTNESSLCYYLDTKQPWDEFLASKSRKFRKNLRAAGRKLEKQGDLQYHVYREWSDIEEQIGVYREIERRSRKEADGVGIASSEESLAFYYSIAEAFAEKGDFCMRVLTLDDKPIVATFGIYFDNVFYSLQITHDLAYSNASPGTYLELLELEECYAEDRCELYDFLGSFVSNKSRWSSTKRSTESVHVYQPTLALSAVYAMHFMIEPYIGALAERVIPVIEKIKTRFKNKV